jgi:hypothetical protein
MIAITTVGYKFSDSRRYAVMGLSMYIIIPGFAYSLYASFCAYRESGDYSMLLFPNWIDKQSGISRRVRIHGAIANALLFFGTCIYLI